MHSRKMPLIRCIFVLFLCIVITSAEDPYRFFTWNVTYGAIYPLGVPQQGILINGKFPGPDIYSVTNDNIIVNVFNSLDEPFLIHWNGVQNRRNSYEDGVYGTTCPIPPGKNFTYILQMKDQIGSFFYFPSLGFHKAAGGFGGIKILSRPLIPVPFDPPSDDFTVLIGDWYKANHTSLRAILDGGNRLPFPDGIIINGRGPNVTSFTIQQGKPYRFRVCNVGLQNSLNFRIQGHKMKVVEIEGTHTVQTSYSAIDVHVGQCTSVLVTGDQPPQDYYIIVSSRFTQPVLVTTGFLRYAGSIRPATGPLPGGPTTEIDWSLNQARSFRTNLTASAPRPNPQGSYHYGRINPSRTIILSSSAGQVNDKQRYAINSISFVPANTPLKVADYFKISGVFHVGSIRYSPNGGGIHLDTSVMGANYRAFVEIVFQNDEDIVQSYHLSGYSFWVVGMDGGRWSTASRNQYNLRDAVSRCTVQVYPKSWTAIYIALDNVGMWNMRSELWARQYLGQQFYLRVYTASMSLRDEYPIPKNALLCGYGVTVTNDGATILKSLHIDNPAAKLVDIYKVDDDEVGDRITSVVVLAGELLREAEKLVNAKIHPMTIISGFRMAAECARNALLEKVVDNKQDSEKSKADLMKIAMTTLSSKILSQEKEHFAKLAVDAV